MLENPRRGRQAINFTTKVPKILVLKSSSEQIFSRKLPLGAPDIRDTFPQKKKERKNQNITIRKTKIETNFKGNDDQTQFVS